MGLIAIGIVGDRLSVTVVGVIVVIVAAMRFLVGPGRPVGARQSARGTRSAT